MKKTNFEIHPVFVIYFILSLGNFYLAAEKDLEELSQNFVLDTFRIKIPDHPHAFNPSIIRWNGSIYMSFRELPGDNLKPKISGYSGMSWIGVVKLDENFNPAEKAQILIPNLEDQTVLIPSRSEDARLLTIDDRLFIVYSDNINDHFYSEAYRMFVAELDHDGQQFILYNTESLDLFEGENKNRREKNWVPFDYKGDLLFAYSLNPHRILQPIFGTGSCLTIATTNKMIKWQWGELRGGTPAILMDNEYLAFFHSSIDMVSLHSKGKKVPHYFMGAYTFSREPPFEITRISPEPIIGKNFYNGKEYHPYWKPVRVVFPCGFLFDENYIWIAYGRQDHEIWIVKLDKKGLYNHLKAVKK